MRPHTLGLLLVLAAASGCQTVVPKQKEAPWGISGRTRDLAEKGQFHAAMRLLPDAMRQWDEHIERTGETHEGAHGFLYHHVMGLLVQNGDAQWGGILDDPEIPYVYKTEMVFEILEARLGKGSVYLGNKETIIVPRKRRVDLGTEMIRLPETGDSEPVQPDAERRRGLTGMLGVESGK
jgi:hypothetical protein